MTEEMGRYRHRLERERQGNINRKRQIDRNHLIKWDYILNVLNKMYLNYMNLKEREETESTPSLNW